VQVIDEEPGILAHILLSILAYGMFTIAVFQACCCCCRTTSSSTSTRRG
jgi:ABC-type uncharacterized transport system permease subunit